MKSLDARVGHTARNRGNRRLFRHGGRPNITRNLARPSRLSRTRETTGKSLQSSQRRFRRGRVGVYSSRPNGSRACEKATLRSKKVQKKTRESCLEDHQYGSMVFVGILADAIHARKGSCEVKEFLYHALLRRAISEEAVDRTRLS